MRDQTQSRTALGGRAVAVLVGIGIAVLSLLVACAGGSTLPDSTVDSARQQQPTTTAGAAPEPEALAADDTRGDLTGSPSAEAPVGPADSAVQPRGPAVSDGQPKSAVMRIPAIGVAGLRVQPYLGQTDDRPGTAIQNQGIAASPHGPAGGVGPGGIGNYQITAHRNTAGEPLFLLPQLAHGHTVEITTDEHHYVYEITETRQTSFRSPRSLEEQRAAVPGHPGAAPTRAMITISTCLTQEDHAAGNYWHDELDNPEHRIDKIGVLVSSNPR